MGKTRDWSFAWAVKEATKALRKNCSLETRVTAFDEEMSDSCLTVQNVGPTFQDTIGVTYRFQALVSVKERPEEAWRKIHLLWRSDVLSWWVHLERLSELANSLSGERRRERLPIQLIDHDALGQILMTVAFSASLGEDHAARLLGDRCRQLALDRDPMTESNILTVGSVEPFLFRVYSLWRQSDLDLREMGVKDCGPFQPIFDRWDDPDALENATMDLCRLHAFKAANYERI